MARPRLSPDSACVSSESVWDSHRYVPKPFFPLRTATPLNAARESDTAAAFGVLRLVYSLSPTAQTPPRLCEPRQIRRERLEPGALPPPLFMEMISGDVLLAHILMIIRVRSNRHAMPTTHTPLASRLSLSLFLFFPLSFR